MGDLILQLTDVSKIYSGVEAGSALTILQGLNLELHRGESLAIIGPSGSGKSTLLNIIGTLDRPSSGQVLIEGTDVTGLDDRALAEIRNRKIGFVFQSHHLLPQCSVLENVLVPTLASSDPELRKGAEERGTKLLDRVGLGSRLNHRPGQLSGGERQRVAVVRALINRPSILLADEPTGALDRSSAANLAALLAQVNAEEGITLVLVTHAMDLAQRMKRQLELSDGRLK